MKSLVLPAACLVSFLACGCARQESLVIEVTPEGPEPFGRSDCEQFIGLVGAVAAKRGITEQISVPDERLGYGYREWWSDGHPVSLHLFCQSKKLQAGATALAKDLLGMSKKHEYSGSVAELIRVLEEVYGPRAHQARRHDLVWP